MEEIGYITMLLYNIIKKEIAYIIMLLSDNG